MLEVHLEDSKSGGTLATALKLMREEVYNQLVPKQCYHIRLCKLTKSWKKGTVKIVFHFTDKDEAAVLCCFVALQAEVKQGKVPEGGLAEAIRRVLKP